MSTKALEISHLTYLKSGNFSFKKKVFLEDISLTVEQGEVFGFLGHNGAGKTTTIRNILNFIHPSSGQIEIFGQRNNLTNSKKNVGYIPEQPYFYDHLTVREAITFYCRLQNIKENELKKIVNETIEKVGLTEKINYKLKTLSKGTLQKVALAQSIASKPKLLILDEPFSGLDPIGRKEFKKIFIELKNTGTSFFIASHILSDIESFCDKVSIMKKGKLLGIYTIKELVGNENSNYIIQTKSAAQLISKLKEEKITFTALKEIIEIQINDYNKSKDLLFYILNIGVEIISFTKEHKTLEDAFVNLIGNYKN